MTQHFSPQRRSEDSRPRSKLYHCILCRSEVVSSHVYKHMLFDDAFAEYEDTVDAFCCAHCRNERGTKEKALRHILSNHFVARDANLFVFFYLYESFFHGREITEEIFSTFSLLDDVVDAELLFDVESFPRGGYELVFPRTKVVSCEHTSPEMGPRVLASLQELLLQRVNQVRVPLSFTESSRKIVGYFLLSMMDVVLGEMSLFLFPDELLTLFPLSDVLSSRLGRSHLTQGTIDYVLLDSETHALGVEQTRIPFVVSFLVRTREEFRQLSQTHEGDEEKFVPISLLLHAMQQKYHRDVFLVVTDSFSFQVFQFDMPETEAGDTAAIRRWVNPRNRDFVFDVLDVSFYTLKDNVVTELTPGPDFRTFFQKLTRLIDECYQEINESIREIDELLSPVKARTKK